MDTSQTDRDKLRKLQQELNPETIGRLVENPIQDPKKYKKLSKQRHQNRPDHDSQPDDGSSISTQTLEISYKSVYLSNNSKPPLVDRDVCKEQTKELPSEIEDDIQVRPWLGMEQLEFDKLEWMSEKAEKAYQEKLKTTTQFDREGRTVSFIDQNIKKNNESTHDIESLVQLLDSAYQPQVTYALNVVAKIAALATMGYYDGAFDENIHDILIKNCLLRVRHRMDSSNETISQAALKCMRSLLCNTHVDEVILDRINPLIPETVDSNLWLQTDEMSLIEFTIEMKDLECVEIDAILALIDRTDILTRLNYLLEIKNGNYLYIDCILDILIRIARHSPDACHSLHRTNIMKKVIKSYLQVSAPSGNHQLQQLCVKALKLVRITALAANEMEVIHNRFPSYPFIDTKIFDEVVPPLEAYFMIDWCDQTASKQIDPVLKIHLETLRTMKALCLLKNCQSKIVSILALSREKLFKSFKAFLHSDPMKKLDSAISFDWQYVANLIDLTGTVMNYEIYHVAVSSVPPVWTQFVRPALLKWLKTIQSYKMIPHLDVSIAVATGVHYYNNAAEEHETKALTDVLSEAVMTDKHSAGNTLRLFKVLARTAAERSQIESFVKDSGRQRDPKGLPSYGSLNFNTSSEHKFKIVNIVEVDSPYILLNMFISQLHADKMGSSDYSIPFIDNIDLIRYIRCTTGYHKYPVDYELLVQQSMFAQYELQLVSRSVLTLARCYLNFTKNDGSSEPSDQKDSPSGKEQSRKECYGNLVYYAISTIGLLSPNNGENISLKDQLLETVLLDSKIQKLVSRESYDKPSSEGERKFVQNEIFGEEVFRHLTNEHLNVLTPVYMSSAQPNRFWIFQPILDYYLGRTASSTNEKKSKTNDKTWFQRNMNWRTHTAEIALATDTTIMDYVLTLNLTMMQYSPCYTHLVIGSNIEDYLCIIGTIFLNDTIFLEESVSYAISQNLKLILKNCLRSKSPVKPITLFANASKTIGPLNTTLADYFTKLVDQYEAVSYCNVAFANFLILFITPSGDKFFKKKLFQEKADTCLSQLRIGVDDVWAREELFYSLKEKDSEILELIHRSSVYSKNLPSSFLFQYRAYHTSK